MKLSQNCFRTDLVFGAILLTALSRCALSRGRRRGAVRRPVVAADPRPRERYGRPASVASSVSDGAK